jgi:hypothetical protein
VSSPSRWQLVVENRDEAPVRLDADARLLWLELPPSEPPAPVDAKGRARKDAKEPGPITCRLPTALRSEPGEPARWVELAPGARWEESFDPALYCFDAKSSAALAAGGPITVHLGFPPPAAPKRGAPARYTGPFVAEPIGDDASALRELPPARFDVAASPVEPAPASGAPLAVTTPPRVDAASARSIVLPVTVTNVGQDRLTLRLRRDRLGFDVSGPTGSVRCESPTAPRDAAPRELFQTLSKGRSDRMDVLLAEVCPKGTFERPGLYRVGVTATVTDSGERWGIGAWTGSASTERPALVRVQRAPDPFYAWAPAVVPPAAP